jgi:hypothetical protein
LAVVALLGSHTCEVLLAATNRRGFHLYCRPGVQYIELGATVASVVEGSMAVQQAAAPLGAQAWPALAGGSDSLAASRASGRSSGGASVGRQAEPGLP